MQFQLGTKQMVEESRKNNSQRKSQMVCVGEAWGHMLYEFSYN